jgi:hypothetical protein
MMVGSMESPVASLNSGEFAAVARALSDQARRLDLVVPGFRSPPRIVGVDRTIRRFAEHESGGLISVAVRDRPLAAIVADMIEGVIVLNLLAAADAARVRAALWRALDHSTTDSARDRTARDTAAYVASHAAAHVASHVA